jgi:hypothetical protein
MGELMNSKSCYADREEYERESEVQLTSIELHRSLLKAWRLLREKLMPKGYWIVRVDITDQEQFKKYCSRRDGDAQLTFPRSVQIGGHSYPSLFMVQGV